MPLQQPRQPCRVVSPAMMPAEITYEQRKTGASYGGYTEMHNEQWAVCSCGWEGRYPEYGPNSSYWMAVMDHRISHLEGKV